MEELSKSEKENTIAAAQKGASLEWNCTVCTMLNESTRTSCIMCGKPKPSRTRGVNLTPWDSQPHASSRQGKTSVAKGKSTAKANERKLRTKATNSSTRESVSVDNAIKASFPLSTSLRAYLTTKTRTVVKSTYVVNFMTMERSMVERQVLGQKRYW